MKRLWVALLLILAFAVPVMAQGETMTLRLFLVDFTQVGNVRNPNHFGGLHQAPDAELAGVSVSGTIDFALQPIGLVAANVTPTQVTYLGNQTDVTVIPLDLDTTLTTQSQVNNISALLEARNIPGTWVNVGDSYRRIIREIIGYFEFMNSYFGHTQYDPITQGINLSVQLGAPAINNWQAMKARWLELQTLTNPNTGFLYTDNQAYIQMLIESTNAGLSSLNCLKASVPIIADFLGYSTSGMTATTTLRQVFNSFQLRNDNRQFNVGAYPV